MDKPLEDLRVGDIVSRASRTKPATVGEDATLKDAVDAMIEKNDTRKVYIIDNDGKLSGTITLETLMKHAGYRFGVRKTGITSFLRMLSEISHDNVNDAKSAPIRVLGDEMILNATKLMVEYHLNDLPVVDNENRLIGELNSLDILRESRRFWE